MIAALRWGTTTKRQHQNPRRERVAIDLTGGHPAMDYAAHENTYKQFLLFTKIGIVCLILLLSGMAYFLV